MEMQVISSVLLCKPHDPQVLLLLFEAKLEGGGFVIKIKIKCCGYCKPMKCFEVCTPDKI